MKLRLRRKREPALDVLINAVTTPPKVACSECGTETCNASGVCGQCGKSPAAGLPAPPTEPGQVGRMILDQSYASHAFGPSPGFPHCCFFCGMGASDPNHADYRAGATVDRDPATGRWAKRDGRM